MFFCGIVVVGDIALVTVAGSGHYSAGTQTFVSRPFRQPHFQMVAGTFAVQLR
jgi:hypothetical protein